MPEEGNWTCRPVPNPAWGILFPLWCPRVRGSCDRSWELLGLQRRGEFGGDSGPASSLKASICRSPRKRLSIIENPICSTSGRISSQPPDKRRPFIVLPSLPPPSPGAFHCIPHLPPSGGAGSMSLQPSKARFSPLGRGAIVPLPSHTSWSQRHFGGRCGISAGTGIYFKTPAFKFFIEPFLPLPRGGHPGKVVLVRPARWERMEGGFHSTPGKARGLPILCRPLRPGWNSKCHPIPWSSAPCPCSLFPELPFQELAPSPRGC